MGMAKGAKTLPFLLPFIFFFFSLVFVDLCGCWVLNLYPRDRMYKMIIEKEFWYTRIQNAIKPNKLAVHSNKPDLAWNEIQYPAIVLASHRKMREFFSQEIQSLPVYHNNSLHRTERPLGIFLFGDEQERGEKVSNLSSNVYPYAMFIIRNYYYDSLFNNQDFEPRMVYMPNGFRTELGKACNHPENKIESKKLFMSFRGGKRGPRVPLVEKAAAIAQRLHLSISLQWTNGFAAGLPPKQFGLELEDSKFSLCPQGNSNETIRFYDAIQCHSIPVVREGAQFLNYFRKVENPLPFPVLNNWDEIETLAMLSDNEVAIMRDKTRLFFHHLQIHIEEEIKKKVTDRINEFYLEVE
uniref:RXYLT1 C-terminal domain-containing protein n=1 Tax=Paramoeba aestuarina TaxID=180227 RepID=A0A7S4NZR4_9EUKA|mmetsp:Transcript_33717/g.52729  ORF Transcript_33717/g.52729 Transcript_33717/m.52729 type:complete len:353 (+) Transcript_33717:62-1120(+)